MNSEIKEHLQARIIFWDDAKQGQTLVSCLPQEAAGIVAYLFDVRRLRFITMTGIDVRQYFELTYHFSDDSSGAVFSVRTRIHDKKDPRIASIAPLIKGANWIEREIHEMLGIVFEGHPNLKHLLLADDWPAGNYPLRQDGKSDGR